MFFVKMVSKQQDEAEKRTETIFKSVQDQITSISDLLQNKNLSSSQPGHPPLRAEPTPLQSDHTKNHNEPCSQPSQSRNQCDLCGKSFGSRSALTKHTRKDHDTKCVTEDETRAVF